MSIFDLFRLDPTRGWADYRLVPLVYDLARGELNGIPARVPFDRLRALGRPGGYRPLSPHSRAACYPTLGLEIELAQQWVDSFACLFQPRPADPGAGKRSAFHSCEIVLQREDGEGVRITADTTLEEVREQIGRGAVHRDEDGSMLQVRAGDAWLYFDFDADGRLRVLDIEPEPVPVEP